METVIRELQGEINQHSPGWSGEGFSRGGGRGLEGGDSKRLWGDRA